MTSLIGTVDDRPPAYPELEGEDETPSNWRDSAMEGHFKAIARWYFWGGALMTLGFLLGAFADAKGGTLDQPRRVVFVVFVVTSMSYCIAGYFLGRFSNGTRRVVLVLNLLAAILYLFGALGALVGSNGSLSNFTGAMIGLLWHGAVVWVMGSDRAAEICRPYYREAALKSPGAPGWGSPFFWIPFSALCMFLSAAALTIAR